VRACVCASIRMPKATPQTPGAYLDWTELVCIICTSGPGTRHVHCKDTQIQPKVITSTHELPVAGQ